MSETIETLRVRGFLCYERESVLQLEPKAYAVVAQKAGDAGSSNWSGKSALLEVVRFVLTGWHRHDLEDDFITDGCPIGEGELRLSGGARVLRTRHRGKRTTLHVDTPDNRHLIQEEAQAEVYRVLGLSARDLVNTCWFEQRETAKFVLLEPADRMEIVSEWLQLGALERCEDRASAELKLRVDAHTRATQVLERERQSLAQLLAGCADVPALEALQREKVELAQRMRDEADAHRAELAELSDVQRAAADAAVRRQLVADLEAAKRAVAAFPDALAYYEGEALRLEQERMARFSAKDAAEKDERVKKRVALGEFDGACPVSPMQCPARDKINAERERAGEAYGEASSVRLDADTAYQKACDAYDASARKVRDVRAAVQRERDVRAKLDAMPDTSATMTPAQQARAAELRALISSRDQSFEELVREAGAIQNRVQLAQRAERAILEEEGRAAEAFAEAAKARAAVRVFGKNGAQRVAAEKALAEVERGANAALREMGIDLSVAVRWSREGSGPAKACEECGAAFPKSEKVKVCAHCGAARGPLVVSKLEVEPSDRSGAAEDLSGIVVQLSAAAWLRRRRKSAWAVAGLDELFGQLDAGHRSALTAHLAGMLRARYGFHQALVVAHHASVLDSLPGRILVESDGQRATARVVA